MPNRSRFPNGLRLADHDHQLDSHEWFSKSCTSIRHPAEPLLIDAPAEWIRPETAAAISPNDIAATAAALECLPEASHARQLPTTTAAAAKYDALQH